MLRLRLCCIPLQVFFRDRRRIYDRDAVDLGEGKTRRYFASVMVASLDGSRSEPCLHVRIRTSARYCTPKSVLRRSTRGVKGPRNQNATPDRGHANCLKRKGETFESIILEPLSARKPHRRIHVWSANRINMLAHRFCIAPMMDWTGTSQKSKPHQHLSRTSSIMSYQM